jgi:tRNA pseudouridine55 synthase
LLLDKPVGPSSSRVLGHVKHLFHAKKAGHGGTLDPLASGLLPVMFGEATKYAAEGLDADKTYLADIRLGVQTSTADREGEIIREAPVPSDLSLGRIQEALHGFLGEQTQIPPMYSALKKDGRPLYDYARDGQEVERLPRTITLHELELLSWASPCITLRVRCSKGTYIRTLAEDLGGALGLPAHLKDLRRIGVGELVASEMVRLEDLEQADDHQRDQWLKPVDWLIRDWPEVMLDEADARRFQHGQSIRVPSHLVPNVYRVKTVSGQFMGTGRVEPHHLMNPERVRVLSS